MDQPIAALSLVPSPRATLLVQSPPPAILSSMLQLDRATTATIAGTVTGVSGSIAGWVLTLWEVRPGQAGEVLLKTSTDITQINILDVNAKTFAIYFGVSDTLVARNITTILRAQNGTNQYVLAREVLEVVP